MWIFIDLNLSVDFVYTRQSMDCFWKLQANEPITLSRAIIVFNGTGNILQNIPHIHTNVKNILHNTISPAKHCYGSE
jgi:hypothetical protein